ncbi:ser/threonine protein phosphatase [Bacillus sp. J14TS2]|uniref:metallophosphoesterase family protein n=1 Tax=Bacillus sp. J14TS2 TaxID=2807188 RepID=UPI001B194E6B|nr:DNA repair exonuclease [Bacillus sp. J14TS2]GIN73843.1 ser/threonine protein phosphatase [Bacillus sp. J14TS2]
MKNEIHFIHTADLHLDSPFLGLKDVPTDLFKRIQNSTFEAFEKLIDTAIERSVDFIIIVGDLFDGEDRSIKAQARLRQQMMKLEQAGIHAFISHGNHDHLAGTWLHLDMPSNVHIFSEEVSCIAFTTKTGLNVHLYGFSYPTRHVIEGKASDFIKEGEADFHIGLIHGQCESSRSDHQPYAPFTIQELLQRHMDYWALGHIHKSEILHKDPYIVYPGNPQGRHKNEKGKKIGYGVCMNIEGQTSLQSIPTSIIQWESIDIPCEDGITFTELYTKCVSEMKSLVDQVKCDVLLEINLKDPDQLSSVIQQKIENEEFLEMLQEETEIGNSFIWPYKINIEKQHTNEGLFADPIFWNLMNQTISDYTHEEIDGSLSSLYTHVYASRYLSPLTDNKKEQLLVEAQKRISERIAVKKVRENR